MIRCESCGKWFRHGESHALIGTKAYCLPKDEGCHLLGKRNLAWKLAPHEAAALLNEALGESA